MAMLIWQGASLIDGSDIVVLATFASGNTKTGAMTQTHILRSDVSPADAIASGTDSAVCGECPHRVDGSCYVHPIIKRGHGSQGVWHAYARGNAKPFRLRPFEGKPLRLGSYGDPAAVPFEIWVPLIAAAGKAGHTGYTHQWRDCDQRYRTITMASCDSARDVANATRAGWQCFYVHPVGTSRGAGMRPCPASAEAGKRLQCADCLRCGGTSTGRTGNVGIMAHGSGARKFRPAITPGKSLPLAVISR